MDKDYPQQGSGSTPSARTSSIRYVAGRQDAERFGKALYALATNSGIYQESIDTQEVVFIGDGAAWIWNLVVLSATNYDIKSKKNSEKASGRLYR